MDLNEVNRLRDEVRSINGGMGEDSTDIRTAFVTCIYDDVKSDEFNISKAKLRGDEGNHRRFWKRKRYIMKGLAYKQRHLYLSNMDD